MSFRGAVNLKSVGIGSQAKPLGVTTTRPSLAEMLTSSKSLSPNKLKKRAIGDQKADTQAYKMPDKKRYVPSISLFKPQNMISPDSKPGSFVRPANNNKDLQINTDISSKKVSAPKTAKFQPMKTTTFLGSQSMSNLIAQPSPRTPKVDIMLKKKSLNPKSNFQSIQEENDDPEENGKVRQSGAQEGSASKKMKTLKTVRVPNLMVT